jgi:hypothetical protein
MNGQQLFEYHRAFRDFSGTDRDEYAQIVETAFVLFGDEVFKKLEQADREDKKITLGYPIDQTKSPATPDRIILV